MLWYRYIFDFAVPDHVANYDRLIKRMQQLILYAPKLGVQAKDILVIMYEDNRTQNVLVSKEPDMAGLDTLTREWSGYFESGDFRVPDDIENSRIRLITGSRDRFNDFLNSRD